MPSVSARSQQAKYTVLGTDSSSPERVAPQPVKRNEWRSLGTFDFTSRAKVSLSNVTAEGTENLPIAWDAVAFQPLGTKPYHVVGMGDSYASGEGATSDGGTHYFPETDYEEEWGDGKIRNTCHRSTKAWIREARLPGSTKSIGEVADAYGDVDLSFVACSGARTYNVWTGGKWQSNALPQIDLGYLDNHTDLVALSIGGNDARFSDVFKECLLGGEGCQAAKLPILDPATGEPTGETQYSPLGIYLENWIADEVEANITKVLNQIKARAPHARVVLMGYPPLIGYDPFWCPRGSPSVGPLYGLDDNEQKWIDETLAPLLTRHMADAAQSAGVEFIDPAPEFAGHQICSDAPAIWGVELDGGGRADTTPQVMKSFHPKIEGAAYFARALERGLGS
jgi:lysophospholipase L1-like esterase